MKFTLKKEGLTGDTLKFAEAMEASLQVAFDDAVKGLITEAALSERLDKHFEGKGLTEEQKKSISETAEAIRKQAEEIEKIKATGIDTPSESFLKTLEDAKDELKQIQKNGTGVKQFNLKAAAVTTTATSGATRSITNSVSAAGGQRLGEGEVIDIRRGQPWILDYVNVGQTNSSVLIWFDEVAKEGDFAVTAEGVAKPMVQYRFERKSASYQKAAGYSVITDEFERDFPQLYTTIRRLMQTDVRNKVADIVLSDMLSQAPTFSYTGLDDAIDNADNFAAIYAGVTQARTLYFEPNVLFLNPADEAKMKLQKDTTGQLLITPLEDLFDAIIVDPRITAGTFLLGDMTMFNVDMYGDVIVKIGYVNDDLIKNQFTVVVEQFFYDYISTNKLGAMVKGTFNTVKQLLETP